MSNRPDLIETLGSEEAVARAAKIAELNDKLRAGLIGLGRKKPLPHMTVLFTGDLSAEMQSLELPDLIHKQGRILTAIRNAGPFTEDNDPYGERDYGRFDLDGESVMWKISYYDLNMEYHSPDETDPEVTHRVLTIFYARDY